MCERNIYKTDQLLMRIKAFNTIFKKNIGIYSIDKMGTEIYQNYFKKKKTFCRKGKNVLFNAALNTFYLRLYIIRHQTYGNGPLRQHEETHCCHYMGYFFLIATLCLLHAPSHIQDSTYHSLCYTTILLVNGSTTKGLIR